MKSIAIALLFAGAVALGLARLDLAELAELSVTSCVLLGVLTSVAVGLIAGSGALAHPGRAALGLRPWRLVVDVPAALGGTRGRAARELPEWALRLLLGGAFLVIGAVALGAHGAAKLREVGAGPPLGRCKDPETVEEEAEEPQEEPPPPEQAGCALVRRAYELGYSKSLGSCAPKPAAKVAPVPKALKVREPCRRRLVEEPFLHYAWRRWSGAGEWLASVRPLDGPAERAEEVRARLGFFSTLTAASGHALGAAPHASHHLWISAPDPRPASWLGRMLGVEDCQGRFAELPLWPSWRPGEVGAQVQHALGQLLFASRFGTTTACGNYRLHWGAPPDACARLRRDPSGFLRAEGAWGEITRVIDRRRRQVELGELAARLGRPRPPPPPPVSAVVSLQCVSFGAAGTATELGGAEVVVDGERLDVRQLARAPLGPSAEQQLELLAQLAQLLAGAGLGSVSADATRPTPAAPSAERVLDGEALALARLEALEEVAPFAGQRWPLRRAELVEIFPFQSTLAEFIDGFRRRYFAQRGRL
ncbi:MAG: hypothetical protein R3B48_12570 [Kofleriaceae bacterium]